MLVSARFDGGEKEKFARAVYKELNTLGVNCFMVEANRVGEYGVQTMHALTNMCAMLAVCYDTYGAKTESPYSSYAEVTYANENHVRIIPLKLCKEWPPAPIDSDGTRAGAQQNKFVFKPSLLYLEGQGKSAAETRVCPGGEGDPSCFQRYGTAGLWRCFRSGLSRDHPRGHGQRVELVV